MGRVLHVLTFSLCALCCGACARDPKQLDWQIAFDSPGLRERAAAVEARIAKGGCKSDDFVYLSHFTPGKPGTGPPALEPGIYGFVARVQDKNCRWFADGCTQVALPAKDQRPVSVRVAPVTNEALDCDGPACSLLSCGSGASGGPASSGSQADAQMQRPPPADEDAGAAPVDAAMPPPVLIPLEAESADMLRAPLVTIHNDTASGGTCIGYPLDTSLTLEQQQAQKRAMPPADDADGMAVYHFVAPRAGSYRMWGMVIASTVDQDSFWVELDTNGFIQWNDIGHGDQWHWSDIRDFERRTERYAFNVSQGRHTLRVSYRETGTLLDKLLIASDLDYIPY
jgi:hypothetical protein